MNWASPKYNTSAYYPKWATSIIRIMDMRTIWIISFGCLCFREQYIWKWRMDHGRFCKNGRELLQEMYLCRRTRYRGNSTPDGLTEDCLQKFRILLMLVTVIVRLLCLRPLPR
ncbi:hypothetical protein NXW94_30235 [Bacteroides ovatus]|nr:hypothetical protein [Bacteroides ovatus]